MASNSDQQSRLKGVFEKLKTISVAEKLPWNENEKSPSTSQMLKEISDNLKFCIEDNEEYNEKLFELKTKFVLSTNCGENEGTQTIEDTKIALKKQTSDEITKKEQVTRNLMKAIDFLEERNVGEDKGLLDVEECIQDLHKVLMKNLLCDKKLGRFSVERRVAGDGHVYPLFETENDAFDEVLNKVDSYNHTIDYIKHSNLDPIERNLMFFKCAAWILYHFVTLHPFTDGNGRMCRLLASHCLYLVFPFPCPSYNVYASTNRYNYYVSILKARSEKVEDLDHLVALLIESGWYAAKYLKQTSQANRSEK